MGDKKVRVILITGASSGIGLSLVQQLKSLEGVHIVATARLTSLPRFSANGVEESGNLWIRPMDVLKKADRDRLMKEVLTHFGSVDVLVNNAGYMLRAVVEHVGEMERFKQIDTNFRAPMALIRAVLPEMRRQRSGHIINISSVGGMMAMPTMSVYCASKFALEGATESLWYEVKPWGINVSLIQPGFINSDGHLNVKQSRECQKSQRDRNDPYFDHYNSMTPFITKIMQSSPASADSVAKVVIRTIFKRRPPLRVAATWDAHLWTIFRRLMPRGLYHNILYLCLPKVKRWGQLPTEESLRVLKRPVESLGGRAPSMRKSS